ncbi:Translin family protein [uncultured archaeon]|nr:Translin family protein [uncultured archaeon]
MQEMPDIEDIEKHLIKLQKRKDRVMDLSRNIIRMSGKAITLMHAGRLAEANFDIKKIRALVSAVKKLEGGLEYYSLQAHQEYVEASAFYTVVKGGRLASRKELGTGEVAYLLGMMDLVGELKREAMEAIRNRELGKANQYCDFMKGIYDSTRGMRFASSLVPDFRRKQDTARIQIEGTVSELLRA